MPITKPVSIDAVKQPEQHKDTTCPFQHPMYSEQQPPCLSDCALYDDRDKCCCLRSDPAKVAAVYFAKQRAGRR